MFPQAHEWDFLQKGINIHDPQYLTWWEAGSHLPNTYEYNRKWAEFVRKNQTATASQILQKGRELMTEYGIKTNY